MPLPERSSSPQPWSGAVIATYLQGKDAWFEFDYAQLLDHLVN